MRSRALVLLLALALLAAAAAWWMSSAVREPERVAFPAIEAPRDGKEPELEPKSSEAAPAEALGEPEDPPRAEVRAPVAAPSAAASIELPPDTIFIEGRVLLPPGLPSDEELSVVARGKAFANGVRTHVVPVEPDGCFRASFAPKTRTGKISIASRYLVLDEEQSLRLDRHEGELLLRPTLGGRIHGRVALPPLRPGEDPGWEKLVVNATADESWCSTSCDGEGRFEIGPLPPTWDARLDASSLRWPDERVRGVAVRPGEVTRLEIVLKRGVALSGRVIDAAGSGVEGVHLHAMTTRSPDGRQLYSSKSAVTDEAGGFEFLGLASGEVVLSASRFGHPTVEQPLGSLFEGDVRGDVVLRVGAGASIDGLVRWPDGRPAAGAEIALTQELPPGALPHSSSESFSLVADEAGSFRLEGLGPEPCDLRARARPARPDAATNARKAPYWEARLVEVRPGSSGIELVLSAGFSAAGRVVNDAGKPIERFVIVAEPSNDGERFPSAPSMAFESADGRFEMQGLSAGRWRIRAEANRHVDSPASEVDLPGHRGALELVLTRCGSVAGRVLDAQGEPVVGATIHRRDLDAERRARGSSTDQSLAKSGTGGGFHEPRAEPGRFALVARASGYGESEPVVLELAPAGELHGIVLHVRREARIEGVVRATGDAVAGREIHVVPESGEGTTVRTGPSGEFTVGGLAPGRHRVVLEPVGRDAVLGPLSDNETAVDLAPGATARVVLPTEPAHAIVVHGRVTAGDRPVAGCALGWVSTGSSRRTGAVSDEDGRYRVVLDVAGTWGRVASFGDDTVASGSVEVPDARAFEHDVALPTGRISGTLRDEDGRALVGFHVSIPPAVLSKSLNRPPRRCTTDDDGRYAFEYVPAGTVQVVAGGSDSWRAGEDALAASELTVELSDGERRDGVDLVLHPGGTIEGRVVDAVGRPVQDSIRLFDSTGQLRTVHRSAPDGRFRIPGLAPGSYGISVGRSKESTHTARVEAGRVTSIDLVRND